MSRVTRTVTTLGLLPALFGACGNPFAPFNGIQLSFRAVPASVQTGDSFTAILTIVNTRLDTLAFLSGDSCVATLTVTRGITPVLMTGSSFGCLAVVTSFRIPPRDSLVRAFQMEASIREDAPPFRTFLAPGGLYTIHTRMHVDLPDVAVSVLVRD